MVIARQQSGEIVAVGEVVVAGAEGVVHAARDDAFAAEAEAVELPDEVGVLIRESGAPEDAEAAAVVAADEILIEMLVERPGIVLALNAAGDIAGGQQRAREQSRALFEAGVILVAPQCTEQLVAALVEEARADTAFC